MSKEKYTPGPLRRVYPHEAWACHTCGRRLDKGDLYVVGADKGIRCIECVFPDMLEALENRTAILCESSCNAEAGLHTGACEQANAAIAKVKGE